MCQDRGRLTDGGLASASVLLPVTGKGGDDGADDDERDAAADGTAQQQLAATDVVDEEDGREGEDLAGAFQVSEGGRVANPRRERTNRVGDTVHASGQERRGVRVETELGEDGRRVVDDSCAERRKGVSTSLASAREVPQIFLVLTVATDELLD